MAWSANTFVHKNENVFFWVVGARQYVSPFICNMSMPVAFFQERGFFFSV